MLFIRADASPEIGTGHVMRCLAFAERWIQTRGQAVLVSAQPTPWLRDRAATLGLEVVPLEVPPGSPADARELARRAQAARAEWVLVDGYHFGESYQRGLKAAGLRTLLIDDTSHLPSYHADILLNQNLGAQAGWYRGKIEKPRMLLGSRFALLRGEFLKWRAWQRTFTHPGRKVLVTLGGSDSGNATLKVIQALDQCAVPDLHATVVAGASNPNLATLTAAVASSRVVHLLEKASNMPELMAEADLAIAAGGATAWELAFMGLPMLLLILADNQAGNVESLHRLGTAQNLGWPRQLSPAQLARAIEALLADSDTRTTMSGRGRGLVDGNGAFRVWLNLNEDRLRLRQVTMDDARQLWTWANASDVREVSFSSEPIPWERHLEWLRSKLADPNVCFWMVLNAEGQPLGQVRFEAAPKRQAVISILLDAACRGQSLGSLSIWSACKKLFDETNYTSVQALIKPGNEASVRAFLKAGFLRWDDVEIKGRPARCFGLTKPEMDGLRGVHLEP
jgi:UDP-2,4-diacetamido-2,4,6-trideoxy-beta-L-altropyranose hydrolase